MMIFLIRLVYEVKALISNLTKTPPETGMEGGRRERKEEEGRGRKGRAGEEGRERERQTGKRDVRGDGELPYKGRKWEEFISLMKISGKY